MRWLVATSTSEFLPLYVIWDMGRGGWAPPTKLRGPTRQTLGGVWRSHIRALGPRGPASKHLGKRRGKQQSQHFLRVYEPQLPVDSFFSSFSVSLTTASIQWFNCWFHLWSRAMWQGVGTSQLLTCSLVKYTYCDDIHRCGNKSVPPLKFTDSNLLNFTIHHNKPQATHCIQQN